MYLTKIDLDKSSRAVWAALSDCQKMHRLLNGLCDTARDGMQMLYRIQNTSNRCSVYLYSSRPLLQEKLLPFMTFIGKRDLTEWVASMTEGKLLRFDLQTMPSKKIAEPGAKNSRRRILRLPTERMAWLERKAAKHGFQLIQAQELECTSYVGKHTPENGGTMVWDVYHYTGVLKIIDAAAFQQALSEGIGPGKAYGLGMILLF